MSKLIKIISKMIRSIRNRDAANVAGRTLLELDAAPAEDTILQSVKNEIVQLKDRLVTAIQPGKLASELEILDGLRDDTYRAFVYLIRGYAHHLDAAIKSAAEEVLKVLNKYGLELTRLNYAAETIEIESLIKDMKLPAMATHLEAMPGAQDLLGKLESELAQFVVAQKAYLDAVGEGKLAGSATEIKKELVNVINNKLVMYLNGMMQVNPEPYTALYTKLDIVIDEANELVRLRRKNEEEIEVSNN